MCGINGGWIPGGMRARDVQDSLDAMRHRGPDDSGMFIDGPAFLGNRRLSIIDLAGGHQPIFNENGSVAVVLNGEIYNYVELIPRLVSKGHRIATKSDTEVLVHLYEEEGPRMCRYLRGMFAFAIWDMANRTLFLGRDRFGKKPLYYVETAGGMLFASELKALRRLAAAKGDTWTVRGQGIYDYLSLSAVPQPDTIYHRVFALPPASWMKFQEGKLSIEAYWHLAYAPKTDLSYARAQQRTRELVGEAVRLRLRSDTPLGVFLSGGLDSSVVAYEASRVLGQSLRTFTIGTADASYDESGMAKRTADFLGVGNTVLPLEVSPLDELQRLVELYDQPYSDSSAIPSLAVARLAREHVKVVLNGDGGDELFAGYRRYAAVRYGEHLSRVPVYALQRLAALLGDALGPTWRRSPVALLHRLLRGAALPRGERYLVWTVDLMREEDKQAAWLGEPMRRTEDWLDRMLPQGLSALDTQMCGDVRILLLSILLVKMDMATMGASVEGRSPFMDHEVAEFAATLPDHYKVRYGRLKAVVRDAYRGLLPDEVVDRGKFGFEIPLLSWLRHELRPIVMDTLGSNTAKVRSYLAGWFLDDVLAGKRLQTSNWAELVYALLMLELWLRGND
jgi:asparagine synthase (glutamine-hydrolysing)